MYICIYVTNYILSKAGAGESDNSYEIPIYIKVNIT